MTQEYEDLKEEMKRESVDESHYKQSSIEPIQYIEANFLDFKRGNIVKYVTRDLRKNKDNDIKKVINYAVMCLKYDYGYSDADIAEYMRKTFVELK
jgi:hypothetical protein